MQSKSALRHAAERIVSWDTIIVAALIALSLPLALAPAPPIGIACARIDIAMEGEPQFSIGSRSLCDLPSDLAGRELKHFTGVTIGMLGRVVIIGVEPATDSSGSRFNASIEALAYQESEDPIFRWEGSVALPQPALFNACSRTPTVDFSELHRDPASFLR